MSTLCERGRDSRDECFAQSRATGLASSIYYFVDMHRQSKLGNRRMYDTSDAHIASLIAFPVSVSEYGPCFVPTTYWCSLQHASEHICETVSVPRGSRGKNL